MKRSEIDAAIPYFERLLANDQVHDYARDCNETALHALNELKNDGWIPCSEKLPDAQPNDTNFYDIIEYFATIIDLDIPQRFHARRSMRNLGYALNKYGEPVWITTNGYRQLGKNYRVLAWQPTPEQYEGEER